MPRLNAKEHLQNSESAHFGDRIMNKMEGAQWNSSNPSLKSPLGISPFSDMSH